MPSKETLFDQATKQRSVEADWSHIPDSTYHMCRRVKGIGVLAHSDMAENLPFNLDFYVWHRANADENSKFPTGANPSERDYRYAYDNMVANAIGEILARALPANLVPTVLSFDACEIPACDAMLLTVNCEFEICGFGLELEMELDTGEGRLRCVDDPQPEPSVTSAALTCEGYSDDGDFLAYIWDTDTPEWRTNPDAEE